MNNESFCLPGDWTCGCMDNMSDSEANFLFFGNDDGFVSTAKRPNGRNVKVWVHFKGGVPVIRLQWKGGWSEYRPAIDGNGLIKIIYDRYFDEKKESRSNIKDALFHVPNSNDLWNRVKTAMDEYVLYKNNVKINENRKMNKKQTIKLDESQLMWIVNESVKKILQEKYSYTKFSVGDVIIPKGGLDEFKVLDIEPEYSPSRMFLGYNYYMLEPSGNKTYYGCKFVDENFELASNEKD